MGKPGFSKWLGLYALLPLMVALMLIDINADMSETWRRILLAAIVLVVCALALAWVDRHPLLVERSGAGLSNDGEAGRATFYTRRLCVPFDSEFQSTPIRHDKTDIGEHQND